MPDLVYLASPYSHPDAEVREARFRAACQAAAELLRQGVPVFSPIAHTHPIALCGLPTGWDFWQEYDRLFLTACSSMVVLMLDGWEESAGVRAEIDFMHRHSKPVSYLEPACAAG